MKRENRSSIFAIFAILLAMVLTACGSSGSSGGGGEVGSDGLAKGGFKKSIVYNNTFWIGQFDTTPGIRYQHLYRAGDIKGSGNITALRFQYDTDLAADVTCNNTTLKLGHTNVTDLTATFADAIETGQGSFVTAVNNTAITIPAGTAGEFFEIPLTSPFNYNGADNLLLEITRTSACSGTVFLDTGLAVGYTASVIATPATAATGAAYQNNISISFQFSGGNNAVPSTIGTAVPHEFPFTGNATLGRKVQLHYTAAEIDGSGPVTGIAFMLDADSTAQEFTYTVKMGHATISSFAGNITFANNFSSAPVTAANNTLFKVPAGIPAGEYCWFPLPDSVFNYNGTDNLIVEIETTATTGTLELRAYNDILTDTKLVGNPGSTTGIPLSRYHPVKFRFNGAPVQIIPVGGSNSRHVLGGVPGTGAGQLQSLYTPGLIGTGGTVTGIGLRLKADSVAATIPDYKIYMGTTAKTMFDAADSYSSNMEINSALVFNGSFDIPAGLKAGDWISIPLQTAFTYDPTQNMSILFMADSASPGNNPVSTSSNGTWFPANTVGRSDNSVDITGSPGWMQGSLADVQLNISK